MVTFSDMCYAMTHSERVVFMSSYWDNPFSFYNHLNRWMYDSAFRVWGTKRDDIWSDYMAGKSAAKKTETETVKWGGFKNVTLTEKEDRQFEADFGSGRFDFASVVDDLLTMGKVSFSYRDGSFSCTVTAIHDGQNWALSAFSDQHVEAACLLHRKVSLYPTWVESDATLKRKRG